MASRADTAGTLTDEWRRLRAYVGRRGALDLARELGDAVSGNKLLVYASAISYQVLFALIPFALALVALLGFLDLTHFWTNELAPQLRDRLSDHAFALVDQAALRVLGEQRGYWLTAGLALALWEVAGAVRAAMHALNDVYDVRDEDRERSSWRRLLVSAGLAVLVSACIGLALLALHFGPTLAARLGRSGGLLFAVVADVVRFGIVLVLFVFVVGVLIRLVPDRRVPAPWLGGASLLVALLWIAASLLFGLYASKAASYGSVYGGLAVVIVLMLYVYVSAISFLVGVQLDALVRSHAGAID